MTQSNNKTIIVTSFQIPTIFFPTPTEHEKCVFTVRVTVINLSPVNVPKDILTFKDHIKGSLFPLELRPGRK